MTGARTVCARDCYDTCFMTVSFHDSEPVRTMGEKTGITQGVLCPRGYQDIKRATSENRILHPFVRVNDAFQQASWSDALDLIAETLTETRHTRGPQSCLQLCFSGNQGLFSSYLPQRLFYALGFTQTDSSLCSKSGHEALNLHYGLSYGVNPDELPEKDLTVYWGFNAAVSAPHFHRLSLKSQKNGGIIVSVDPRKSETAHTADLWIQIQPGSDVALVYGILKYLIESDQVDRDFITRHTYGSQILEREARNWTEERVEVLTGVKWEDITYLGDLYAEKKSQVTLIGIGMQKSVYGSESVRAVSLLPAVSGVHRGFFYSNAQGFSIDYLYLTGESLAKKPVKSVSQVAVGSLLEQGIYPFVYVHNMNPAQTLPNAAAVRRGFERDDVFVAVHDTHWTETASCADIVLPAPTFLEKEDVVIPWGHRYVRKSSQVIPPVGESRSELWVMAQLAHRLGLDTTWVCEDCWKAIEKALEHAFENGSVQDLRTGSTLALRMNPCDEYQTPTGKIELASTKAGEYHASPLPVQHPLSSDEKDYTLLTSSMRNYTHTQFQDIYGPIPPLVFIGIKDALRNDIKDSDIIILYNELGSIAMKAVISVSIPPGAVWIPRQGNDLHGIPVNSLTPGITQEIGGGPTFNSIAVRIRKSSD
ncbi:MAG: molybdopterin-dependent oxidoreductase [Theionarchaea archaeon]|nr:molybdopterin-dependent oxidoreductase [Theionarchaea archaeon]